MYPIILERDTDVINWATTLNTLSTIESDPEDETIRVKSSGTLNVDYGTLTLSMLSGVITARRIRAAGVHITGPQPGNDFTPYAVSVQATCADESLRPYLLIGESPATITSNDTGDVVTNMNVLATPMASNGSGGSSLQRSFTAVVAVKTDDRALCFALAFLAGVGASLNDAVIAHLTVRRLIGLDPSIIDARKL